MGIKNTEFYAEYKTAGKKQKIITQKKLDTKTKTLYK